MPAIIMSRLNYGAIGAINALGLTSGLKLCLDAGDDVSLPAGSATWNDLSGGAYHFNRGTTSGAESSDPSINGTAGGLSSAEYLGFDGGDWLTLAQANPAWVNNLHKDNVIGGLACWAYSPVVSGGYALAGTNAAATANVGFNFNIRTTGVLRFGVTTGSGVALNMDSIATMAVDTWTFLAVSFNEGVANSGIMQIGATQETGKACAYTSPSASSASFTMQVACVGNGETTGLVNGSRKPMFWAWEGVAPTAVNWMDLYNITRGRFGV